MNLPDFDGFQVSARLTRDPAGPIVVLTSSRDGAEFRGLYRERGSGIRVEVRPLRPRAQRSARLTLFDVLGNLRRRARVARWRGALAPNSIPSKSRARARPGRPPRRRPRRSAPPTLTARSMRPRERTSFATSACDFGEDLGAQAAASVSGSPRGRSPAPMSACPRAPSRPLRPTVVGPQPRNALRARAAGLGGGQSAGAGRGEAPTPPPSGSIRTVVAAASWGMRRKRCWASTRVFAPAKQRSR